MTLMQKLVFPALGRGGFCDIETLAPISIGSEPR